MGNFRRWLSGATISGGLILLGIAILVIATLVGQPTRVAAAKPATPTTASTAAPAIVATDCDKKFVQMAGNNASNRVDADFAAKYGAATASSNNLAMAQKSVLLENSANNAQRLAIWSNAFGLYANPNNWQSLVRGNCLSPEGQALYYKFEGALSAKGTTFQEAQAPANAYNSGVSNGTYGVGRSAGIMGNRKAIKVTMPDGSVVMILVRCGNVVNQKRPNLPVVPTDNRPPVTPNKVCPPNQPHGTFPVCKDSPNADPAARGNAPVGGGTNLNPGPGTFIPPSLMVRPPAAPRVNPAPPRVITPPVGSTPDPAPAPAPEPQAPPPGNPATGCSPPPGMTTC